ncbi:peroxisome proliferator-activated receptor gamma [Elysia marginata]|uniref:Peroxisome proliferator-activated receptor gamma n=1 Tax=Elysia marginata TaxID=1093978 RepID=A0AAV4HIR9_9GAST|nr:peroxisome proliferator-activated receptor gamma [Elysia marginata]
MAELMKLLQSSGSFKSDLMQTLLSQSHQRAGQPSTTITSTASRDANLNVSASTTPATTNTNINDNTSSGDSTTPGDINLNTPGTTPTTAQENLNRNTDQPFYVDPNANCLSDVNKVLSEMKEIPAEQRRVLIDQITDVATEAHMSSTLNTQASIREASERIDTQMKAMGNQMPDMSKLTINPSAMMQHFLNSMVPEMTKVVNFSKQLPGFSDLDTEDQITLIKQGIFEVMISRITLLIDYVKDSMIDPSLKMKSPRSVVRQMSPMGPFIDQFFDIAKKTHAQDLTDGENGLFGAILMLCPDRHGLKNVTAVQTIQHLYLQALHLLLKHNHKDADELFCKLISSIPAIRKINDDHFRFLNNIKQKSDSQTHLPQLHRELFDVALH